MTFLTDAGNLLGNVRKTCSSIKNRIPLLRRLHLNFISLHYAYIIACALTCSIIIYPSGGVEYVDALFLSACAATQSGLNTVDLNSLFTYQQVILWFISMISNPIVMHSFVVFVRLYSFEIRFQHLARDARTMRRTRSRSATVTGGRDDGRGMDREERGVGNRRIVVLRNNAGEARGEYVEDFPTIMKPDPDTAMKGDVTDTPKDESVQSSTQSSETRDNAPMQDKKEVAETDTDADIADVPNDSAQSSSQSSESRDNAPVQDEQEETGTGEAEVSDDDTVRGPTKKDNEHHISFLINQRSDRGALRIPGPREYDRGGGPQALDDDGNNLSRRFTAQSERPQTRANRESTVSPGPQQSSGPHITIDEPNISRSRARTTSFPTYNTSRTDTSNEAQESSNPLSRLRSRKGTLSTLFSAKSRDDEDPMPYLSWQPTVGRNSAFVDLTEAQRDELGGIEYRALKTLAVILIGYFLCFHLLGVVCLVPWIMESARYSAVVNKAGQDRGWWGIFTAGSAFNDVGFTLTPNSMISFQEAIFPLLLMTFLIVIGNTGFPCMLRFIIWVLSKIAPKGGVLWEELKFLLDHPRRMFTLLFPRSATWWLFAVLVILNGVDLIFFIILDLHDPDITSIPPGARVVDGLFQASATRTAGFSVISLSELHPATQVSYLIMMYISVFPIAISMRRTNVYEERSLGVYSQEDEDEDEETDTNSKDPSYVGAHLRKQLSFDLWYIALGLFFIAIVEGTRLQMNNNAFTLYSVLFEIISAYGTVGLSLGYPGFNTSFSGQFKPLSKLIIVAMQIRGRHRGLPYKLDRAVLLPSEALHKKELADAERRMRRRGSNVSSFSTLPVPQGQQPQQGDEETASSTALAPERLPPGALGESTAHHRFLGNMVARLANRSGRE